MAGAAVQVGADEVDIVWYVLHAISSGSLPIYIRQKLYAGYDSIPV